MILFRHCYAVDRTMGELHIDGEVFHTIERPWISSPHHKGGMNFKSCIPDGEYLVKPYESEARGKVWRLTNPDLDVFGNRPSGGELDGRWDILIHKGNYVHDVVGCIAVGTSCDDNHVWKSAKALERLRELLTEDSYSLVIMPKGTRNA